MHRPWKDLPPGPERQAAKRKFYSERRPISADAPITKTTINGLPAIRGPSKISHPFTNEAEHAVAVRLARTHAEPFPSDLLTAELDDGRLIVACRSAPDKLVIPRDLSPRFFEIAVDHLAKCERERRADKSPNENLIERKSDV